MQHRVNHRSESVEGVRGIAQQEEAVREAKRCTSNEVIDRSGVLIRDEAVQKLLSSIRSIDFFRHLFLALLEGRR